MFSLKGSLLSLIHEISRGIAQTSNGIPISDFNSLSEYEQDLTALGFPALLPSFLAGNFDELHDRCRVFDQYLQTFLTENGVGLRRFTTFEQLQHHLSN